MFKFSTKQKVKEAAENILHKLSESLDSSKKDEDRPPTPPPKPYATSNPALVPDFTQSFAKLSVSSPPPVPNAPGFVGGFHPGQVVEGNAQRPSMQSAYSAPPPSMPTPFAPPPPDQQSLTMQMALDPNLTLPPRPSSTPTKPTFKPSSSSPSKPAPTTPSKQPKISSAKPPPPSKKPVDAPLTPKKPKRTSATPSTSSSPPSTPSGKAGQVQCAGTTKAGKQCTRFVKTAPALDGVTDENDGDLLERFCFQHTKELLGPSGCYARKNGEWIDFNDWIPIYLQTETQLALRIEMERSRSQSDVDGFIYTFEIRDGETESVKLKVGRAVNLVKRIDEWGKQCGSKEQVLRGYYPGPEAQGVEEGSATLMKGRVRAGEKASCCHRLERLIHLELADLTSTRVYLDPAWPEVAAPPSPPSGKGPAKRERCEDCGSMHKEIFEFQRWSANGANKNKEWERIVKPVIERWGMFVELYI